MGAFAGKAETNALADAAAAVLFSNRFIYCLLSLSLKIVEIDRIATENIILILFRQHLESRC